MDPQAMGTIFTLLVAAGLVGLVIAIFGSRQLRAEVERQHLRLAAVVATGATLASLYFSETEGFTPCEFCWFQRIAMYPLAAILVMAAIRGDRGIRPYASVLATAGGVTSIYHYQLQVFPDQGSSCSSEAPCTARWIEIFGFVSIPLLALGCFALVLTLLWAIPARSSSHDHPDDQSKLLERTP